MTTMATAVAGSVTRVVSAKVMRTTAALDDRGDKERGAGAGLVAHPQVAGGDEREHEQRDGAADRRDRAEVEADGEDDRDRRGQEQSGWRMSSVSATELGWELTGGRHLLAEAGGRVQPGVRRACRREEGGDAHEPVAGAAEDRFGSDRDGGPARGDDLVPP